MVFRTIITYNKRSFRFLNMFTMIVYLDKFFFNSLLRFEKKTTHCITIQIILEYFPPSLVIRILRYNKIKLSISKKNRLDLSLLNDVNDC